MASLTFDNIRKAFGGGKQDSIVAVDDVSIDIADGEFVVLVGPSGSGKSTILRLLSGLEELTDGGIYIDEREISGVKPKDRDIAMVFQNYALYPHLTAGKNISFGLRMRGELSDEEITKRVDEAARIMDIEELLEKMPGELSGGQQQRVALGRAIVRNPEAFLMDEPLSNLDAKLRTTMRTEIQQLQSELGVTTIYVTHDQTEAMTMGDRIAIMNHGKLQQVATPLEAYYEPANRFVAGFIGSPSMNFIDVSVSTTNDTVHLEHEDFTVELSSDFPSDGLETYDEVVLGIRPESIELADGRSDGIDVPVDVVEPLGKEQLLYFTLNDATYIASVEGHRLVSKDQEITLVFPEERLHLFESETGETIRNRDQPTEGERDLSTVIE